MSDGIEFHDRGYPGFGAPSNAVAFLRGGTLIELSGARPVEELVELGSSLEPLEERQTREGKPGP